MSVNIDTIEIGDTLAIDGEVGTVQSIDYDENMIYLAVPVTNGVSVLDVDPDEPGLEKREIKERS